MEPVYLPYSYVISDEQASISWKILGINLEDDEHTDFTELPGWINFGMEGAMEENRYSIDNETYMLKIPSSVRNSWSRIMIIVLSMNIFSHIYESLGIDTQKTILGTYKTHQAAVFARIPLRDGSALKDLLSPQKSSILCNSESGYSTEFGWYFRNYKI